MSINLLGITRTLASKVKTFPRIMAIGHKSNIVRGFDPSGNLINLSKTLPTQEVKHKDVEGNEKVFNEKRGFNIVVINVKDQSGNIKEEVVRFIGKTLLLSKRQNKSYSKELKEKLATIGAEKFEENHEFHTVILNDWARRGIVFNEAPVVPPRVAKLDKKIILPVLQPPPERQYVTASTLYNHAMCEHRVWRDAHFPKEDRDPPHEFVQLLWEKGITHEKEVMEKIGKTNYVDLSEIKDDKIHMQRTIEEIQKGTPLIYQGLLMMDELKGIPDLLERQPDGTYMPVDIKAAMAFDGSDGYEEGKLKVHYALQLALYLDALQRLGFTKGKVGMIIDSEGNKYEYNLELPKSKKDPTTFWDLYEQCKDEAIALIKDQKRNEPELKSVCKLCHWYSSCLEWCKTNEHPTLLYRLGSANYRILNRDLDIKTVSDVGKIDFQKAMQDKAAQDGDFLKGVAEGKLIPWIRRADVLLHKNDVVILNPISFPDAERELHLDIEADPTRDHIYLHGIVQRKKGEAPKYHAFITQDITPEAEKKAFQELWSYIRSLPKDFVVYHYSHYEPTMYKKLMYKYPDVVSREELEDFFSNKKCVDLYKVVDQNTDWPLTSYSLKDIAKFIGFNWRDEHPSGSASIVWFNEWVKTKDEATKNRILLYNEDDCMATTVVKDYLEKKTREQTPSVTSLQI